MKYVIYAILILTGYGLNYGLMPNLLPFWLSIDILLAIIIATAQTTKDYTAMFLGFASGLLVDIFIFKTFGLHTLMYSMCGYFYAKLCEKSNIDNFFVCAGVIFVSYLGKEIIYMLVNLLDGVVFKYFSIFFKFTLLSGFVNGVVGFLIVLFIFKLHELRCMKVKHELDFLRSYKEKNDWLGNWFE